MGCSSSTPVQGTAPPKQAGANGSNSFKRDLEAAEKTPPFHAQYVLSGKLGKGAFAQVHLCRKVENGIVSSKEDLAVKITDLRKRVNGKPIDEPDPRGRRAVEKEVTVMRMVGQQVYCVHQKDSFIEDIFTYIVMEKCDMTLLQALERSQVLNEPVLSHVFRDILEALVIIHAIGVVHRDLKPDNFLCVGGGNGQPVTVKTCDFGLAAILPDGQADGLQGVYGTAPFMSPEMLKSQMYGAKTDLWSIGVIVYVLLFGEFPYRPAECTSKAMKAAIATGSPLPGFVPKNGLDMSGTLQISTEAKKFVMACLERGPVGRPNAAEARAFRWISPDKGEEIWGPASFRPMLYAAKRCGAFDTRNVNDNSSKEMDNLLSKMQEQYHKGGTGSRGTSKDQAC